MLNAPRSVATQNAHRGILELSQPTGDNFFSRAAQLFITEVVPGFLKLGEACYQTNLVKWFGPRIKKNDFSIEKKTANCEGFMWIFHKSGLVNDYTQNYIEL